MNFDKFEAFHKYNFFNYNLAPLIIIAERFNKTNESNVFFNRYLEKR